VDNLRTSQTVKSSWFEFRRQGHLAFSILITSLFRNERRHTGWTQLVVVPFTHVPGHAGTASPGDNRRDTRRADKHLDTYGRLLSHVSPILEVGCDTCIMAHALRAPKASRMGCRQPLGKHRLAPSFCAPIALK
jgi:hypothetical protein